MNNSVQRIGLRVTEKRKQKSYTAIVAPNALMTNQITLLEFNKTKVIPILVVISYTH